MLSRCGCENSRARKTAPRVVACLLLDQLVKVEVTVELVRLGTRITEDTALVQSFGALRRGEPRQQNRLGTCHTDGETLLTSSTRFGDMRKSREPVFCSSTVVSGRGFLRCAGACQPGLSRGQFSMPARFTISGSAWSPIE